MDPIARWMAVASLLLSLASLLWNIYAWRRSGPKVMVDSPHGATPKDGMVWLEVRNIGRLPVRVTDIGLYLKATKPWPDGAKFPTPVKATAVVDERRVAWAPDLPCELAPTESVRWFFHLGQLLDDAARQRHLIDVEREYLGRPCVFMGTGKIVRSRATRYIAVRFRERYDELVQRLGSNS